MPGTDIEQANAVLAVLTGMMADVPEFRIRPFKRGAVFEYRIDKDRCIQLSFTHGGARAAMEIFTGIALLDRTVVRIAQCEAKGPIASIALVGNSVVGVLGLSDRASTTVTSIRGAGRVATVLFELGMKGYQRFKESVSDRSRLLNDLKDDGEATRLCNTFEMRYRAIVALQIHQGASRSKIDEAMIAFERWAYAELPSEWALNRYTAFRDCIGPKHLGG